MKQNRTQKHIQAFVEGMDKDTSVNKYPEKRYQHAENFRFITTEDNSTGTFINDVGSSLNIEYDTGTTGGRPKLAGWTSLRDELLLFYISYRPTHSLVYTELYKISKSEILNNQTLYINESHYSCVFNFKNFGNSLNTEIRALARRESDYVDKVYWTDGISLKYCIINDNTNSLPEDQFEIFPKFSLGSIEIDRTTGGNLPAGKVQYAYQLYNVRGSKSLVSQLSNTYNLYTSTSSISYNIKGNHMDENTGKGCVVKMHGLDSNFDRIRIFRIHYGSIDLEPDIFIIEDTNNESTSLSITDDSSIGIRQTVVEDIVNARVEIVPKTLNTKNNILFAGNVEEKIFDVDKNNN